MQSHSVITQSGPSKHSAFSTTSGLPEKELQKGANNTHKGTHKGIYKEFFGLKIPSGSPENALIWEKENTGVKAFKGFMEPHNLLV